MIIRFVYKLITKLVDSFKVMKFHSSISETNTLHQPHINKTVYVFSLSDFVASYKSLKNKTPVSPQLKRSFLLFVRSSHFLPPSFQL